jgi:hypothetical protein
MRFGFLGLVLAVILTLLPGQVARADRDLSADSTQLQLEVDALSTLDDLNLTSDQLSSLKEMAKDSAGKLSKTPTVASAEYTEALKALKSALLGKDDDKTDAAGDKAADLADKQDDDSIPDVVQSEAAKSKSVEVLKMLSVKQVADFIAANADDIDEPVDLLIGAIHDCRGLSQEDFVGLRNDTAEELSVFAAGPNPGRPPAIVGKANALLTRAHKMSDAEFSSQQSALEDEARKIAGGMDPIPNLRHWMENEMAELLSNPELVKAIDDWKAAGKVE